MVVIQITNSLGVRCDLLLVTLVGVLASSSHKVVAFWNPSDCIATYCYTDTRTHGGPHGPVLLPSGVGTTPATTHAHTHTHRLSARCPHRLSAHHLLTWVLVQVRMLL
jgi:hypothetical protein